MHCRSYDSEEGRPEQTTGTAEPRGEWQRTRWRFAIIEKLTGISFWHLPRAEKRRRGVCDGEENEGAWDHVGRAVLVVENPNLRQHKLQGRRVGLLVGSDGSK